MASDDSPTTIHEHRLANGVTLLFEPMPWLQSASVTLLSPFGAATDPPGREGAATVLADWLERGAGDLDSRAHSDALDALGVRRGGGAGRETTLLRASLLGETLPQALPLLADTLRRPRFEDEEFAAAREVALQDLASLADHPAERLFEVLPELYFASSHGRSPYGERAALEALTADALREEYRARVGPEGLIVAVAGRARWEELVALVERLFGDWEGGHRAAPAIELRPPERHHLAADSAQTQIGLAYDGVGADHEGWYAQALAMGVLSGGMGSRLFAEVREKRGLVYSVSAATRVVRGFGWVVAYAGTTPDRAEETLDVVLAEIRRLGRGVSEEELARARTGILSDLVMQGESSGARANALAHDLWLRGRPRSLDEVRAAIESVTLRQVNDLLGERPDPVPAVLTLGPQPVVTRS